MAKAEVPAPSQCLLQFKFTLDAASNNASLLGDYGFDLDEFIKHHPGSIVTEIGSKIPHPASLKTTPINMDTTQERKVGATDHNRE